MQENKIIEKAAISEQEAQQVLDQIKDIIVDTIHCEEKELILSARWKNDLGADSLDMAFIMTAIDSKLDMYVNDQDGWEDDSSLRDTCCGIARTLKQMGRL